MESTKKVVLDKRYKEILFAASGFGPNLLMVLMMAYFTDAVIPTGLSADIDFWSYGGVVIVSTAIFPILWTIGRVFDGLVDVPLAGLTDRLAGKYKGKVAAILASTFPMLISFVLCWIPVFGMGKDIANWAKICNAFWIFIMSIVFFGSYTLVLIIFYGSLSTVCENQTQRARVSAYKSVFDTINYALVYAAIPVIFKSIGIPIWQAALILSPLMLTILIPVFMFKKVGSKEASEEENKQKEEEKIPLGKSIVLCLGSRPFMKWMAVYCASFFGLQMFLVSQNTLISGVMNLGAGYAAILNTAAFAPVPIMLYFFNKVRRKRGIRFVYQTCLLSFGVAILTFCFGSDYILKDNITAKLIIGVFGGILGSWGIGAFFMTPYLIPSQIASVEKEVTGKNHSAMYFAVQALFSTSVGAIASSLIYNYLKLWVKPIPGGGEYKCGVSLVPIIVSIACIVGFFLCFLMPKKYTPKVVESDIKKSAQIRLNRLNKSVASANKAKQNFVNKVLNSEISDKDKEILINDINNKFDVKIAGLQMKIVETQKILDFNFDNLNPDDDEEKIGVFEKESIVEFLALTLLSGGIFGIVIFISDIRKLKKIGITFKVYELILCYSSLIIPFLGIYSNLLLENKLKHYCESKNITLKTYKALTVISSIILPLTFINFYTIGKRLSDFNNIADSFPKQ